MWTDRGIIRPVNSETDAKKIKMGTSAERAASPQGIGRRMTLLLLPTGSAVPLGPAWAVLCGAWAAGGWRWEGSTLLALVVTTFVAEVLWSSWRAHLIDTDWDRFLADHPLPVAGDPVYVLPYTTPWSPLGRALSRWGQLRRWVREILPAGQRGAVLALPVLPPLILLLSALVGRHMLLLSLAGLALMVIEWRVARRQYGHRALQAGLEIGLSWMAGHMALAPLTASSFALACCYALAYQGALEIQYVDRAARGPHGRSLAWLYGGQATAAMVVLMQEHRASPLAATAIALLLAPQLLLQAQLQTGKHAITYLQHAALFFMLAMPIAAWAI